MSSSTPAAAASPPPAAAADEGARAAEAVPVDERVASHVDPFLVEALDNPRHRLMGTCPPRRLVYPLAVSLAISVS